MKTKKLLISSLCLFIFIFPIVFSNFAAATGGSSTLMITNQSNSTIQFNATSTYSSDINETISADQTILVDKNDSAMYSYQILDSSTNIILDEGNIAPGQCSIIYNPESPNNPNVCLHSESNLITNWTFQESHMSYTDNLNNWRINDSSIATYKISNPALYQFDIDQSSLTFTQNINNYLGFTTIHYSDLLNIPSVPYPNLILSNLTASIYLGGYTNNGNNLTTNIYGDNTSYSQITTNTQYESIINQLSYLQQISNSTHTGWININLQNYEKSLYFNCSYLTPNIVAYRIIDGSIMTNSLSPYIIYNYNRIQDSSILFDNAESINMSKSLGSTMDLIKGDVITLNYYSQNQISGNLILGNENTSFSGSGNNEIQYTIQQTESLNQLSAIINSAGDNQFNITGLTINSIPTSNSPSISYLVDSESSKNVFIAPNDTEQYKITISDLSGKTLEIFNANINTTSSLTDLYYTSIGSTTCQILYSDSLGNAILFNNFRTQIQYSLLNQTNTQYIQTNTFIADQNSSVIINTYDIFGDLLKTSDFITNSSPATYFPISINLNILTIHSYLQSKTEIELIKNSNYYNQTIFPGETISFDLYSGTYVLNYTDDSDIFQSLNLNMSESQSIELNSTYNRVYFGAFSDDGLGIDPTLFRFYLNGERQNLFNSYMINQTANLKVMDYFNATLDNLNESFLADGEYNFYLPVYTTDYYNNYTNTMIFKVLRSGSDIVFTAQISPGESLQKQFEANITYTIDVYYLNGTFAEQKTSLLNTNSKLVNFGFYTKTIAVTPQELHATIFNVVLTIAILESLVIIFIPLAYYEVKHAKVKKRPSYLEKMNDYKSFHHRLP